MTRPRRCVLLGIALLTIAAAPFAARADELDEVPAIRQLQELLRTAVDRDSVRFALALAYRDTGTLEGRNRAFDLLRQIRARYYDDFRYHREIAVTYLEGRRYDDARESMQRAVKKAPNEMHARGDLAEMLFRRLLRTGDPGDADELLRFLGETLSIDPSDRTALLYKSFTLDFSRIIDPARGANASAAARACTEAILRANPADRSALLLEAVHCLDLGEPDAAAEYFRRGLESADSGDLGAFFYPSLCAPDSVLRRLAGAPPELRDSLRTSYWDSNDPTPLTPVNENLLEYWKRLVLADLFFGRPDKGTRGWETPRGELLVRYGLPDSLRFIKASFSEGEAMVPGDLPLGRRTSREREDRAKPMTFRFLYPAQNWDYTFAGKRFSFSLIDPTLHDEFIEASPGTIQSIIRTAPAVLVEGYHGTIRNCFLGSSGMRGKGGRTAQAIAIGLPAGAGGGDPWAGARLQVRVLDAGGREVSNEIHTPLPGSARPLVASTTLTLVPVEVPLVPGHYTAEVQVTAGERAGTYALPVEVRSFGRDSLQISDLRFAFANQPAEATPNPTGLVPRGAQMEVGFEVYNLTPASGGNARYQVRYTVLPAVYAREYSRLLAKGNAARDPALQFGRLGGSLGGVTLVEGNYVDLLFPPMATPLALAARCRLSFRLETAGLRDGGYALLVTVTDLNARRAASVRCPFTVLSEEAFQSAMEPE